MNANILRVTAVHFSAFVLLFPFVAQSDTPKPTCSIDASPRSIREGEPTRLTWRTANATDVTIAHIGPVAENDFSIRYPSSGRAEYMLTARGEGGAANCSVVVAVGAAHTVNVPWYAPIVSAITYVPGRIYDTVFWWDEPDVIYVEEPVYIYEEPIYLYGSVYAESAYYDELVLEKERYVPYEPYQPYEPYDPYEWREMPRWVESDPYFYQESIYPVDYGYSEAYYLDDPEEDYIYY